MQVVADRDHVDPGQPHHVDGRSGDGLQAAGLVHHDGAGGVGGTRLHRAARPLLPLHAQEPLPPHPVHGQGAADGARNCVQVGLSLS